jgi:prolyl-tRNA synthetase
VPLKTWARTHGIDARSLNAWRVNLGRSRSVTRAPSIPRLVELVPLIVEIGPGEIEKGTVCYRRRDADGTAKVFVPRAEFVANVGNVLGELQSALLAKADAFRADHTRHFTDALELNAWFTPKNNEKPEIHGGFATAFAHDVLKVHDTLAPLKVTARCIPLATESERGTCIFTGKPDAPKVVFAKAY